MNACYGDFSAVHTDSQRTRRVHLRAVAKQSTGIIKIETLQLDVQATQEIEWINNSVRNSDTA